MMSTEGRHTKQGITFSMSACLNAGVEFGELFGD